MQKRGYVLVWTTFDAFESEKILLKECGITIKLVPTPREYSSDCGIAIYFEINDVNKNIQTIENLLKENKFDYEIKILD